MEIIPNESLKTSCVLVQPKFSRLNKEVFGWTVKDHEKDGLDYLMVLKYCKSI